MVSCEKCWWDAHIRARNSGKSVVEEYHNLLKEREANPCTPKEQAGEWWDEEKQCDTRLLKDINF